jgi:hypothetical protein
MVLIVASCSSPASEPRDLSGEVEGGRDATQLTPVPVCDNTLPGPTDPPPGAVVVDAGVVDDVAALTEISPPGTTFWLSPGVHTLTPDPYAQVAPKDGNIYLGAPAAVLDGRGVNHFAFTQEARGVTIRHLTIRGFIPPPDQGVVNHDSGDGWIIEHNTVEDNQGAALMAGAGQQVRSNCLRNNGQYGMNAYQAEGGIVGLVLEGNEIVGNNTGNWEAKIPGCGCTGGVKFWAVNGADIRNNWVHDNRGPGLWADTNNNDFLIEGNVIENNDGEAIFYETSYNLILRNNMIRNNAHVSGKEFFDRQDDFPVAAVYLSEAGGEPRIPARTDQIEIYGNVFQDNWSGITAWENSDRFCNSAANTSTGSCTRLVDSPSTCSQPAIASEPLYSDCRWKTQRVDIRDNIFVFAPAVVGCAPGFAGRMAILANYGTYPDWSPYKGNVIQDSITHDQQVRWRDNAYTGPWTFMLGSVGRTYSSAEWQSDPYRQDVKSTFASGTASSPC